jgi:hypothetical protein
VPVSMLLTSDIRRARFGKASRETDQLCDAQFGVAPPFRGRAHQGAEGRVHVPHRVASSLRDSHRQVCKVRDGILVWKVGGLPFDAGWRSFFHGPDLLSVFSSRRMPFFLSRVIQPLGVACCQAAKSSKTRAYDDQSLGGNLIFPDVLTVVATTHFHDE